MLLRDREVFERSFPKAADFTRSAQLRKELFGLLMRDYRSLTPWERNRIKELKKAPACKEPWFLDLCEREIR